MTHRALPLDIVEARQRAARVAWPMTCNACNTGTPGDCDCIPHVQDRMVEEWEEQAQSADREVGFAILKFVGCVLLACFCVWLIAGGPNSDALEMLLAFLERRNA